MSKASLFQAIQFNQIVLIQTNQFNISIVFVHTQLNVKTVLFQTIQFSKIMQFKYQTVLFQVIQFNTSRLFSSIGPIDRAYSCATTPGQSEPRNDGNKGFIRIPQSSSISVIYRTLVGRLCILQPQPTGQNETGNKDGHQTVDECLLISEIK